MSALEAAAAAVKAAKAAKAAKRAEPFYSAVDEAAKALTRGKGTGKEFMIEVLKKPGVKPTEIKERGLQKIEAMPKMTKEEFLQKLEENPAPKLTETGYAEDPSQAAFSEAYYKAVGHLPKNEQSKAWFALPDKEKNRMIANSEANSPYEEGAKYQEWSLPGGANYREILLKLPSPKSKNMGRVMELEAKQRRGVLTEAEDNELMKLQIQAKNSPEYQSGHWENDPNVLAHIRVSDREGPNGEQILHVEEIQSDWHQEGRKKGYRTGKEEQDYVDYLKELETKAKDEAKQDFISEGVAEDRAEVLADRMAKRLAEDPRHLTSYFGADSEAKRVELHQARMNARNAVPDAPFKKNWHELAMKRVLNYAAEHGYDKVAITPGAEQASRYDLSKQIDQIKYIKNADGTYDMAIRPAGESRDTMHIGNRSLIGLSEDEIEGLVGKDVAQKIVAGEGPQGGDNYRSLSGLDLQVGGEGMMGFYDKIVPDYLNSYGKKYGVQVQMEGLPVKISDDLNFPVETSEANNLPSHVPGETRNLHTFDITPQMREEIMGKGLPLYQQIGIPAGGAAAGAEALQQEEQGFAVGGPVGSSYDTTPDMQDGGRVLQGTAFKKGGRVHLSKNSDTMLLDLLSKS